MHRFEWRESGDFLLQGFTFTVRSEHAVAIGPPTCTLSLQQAPGARP